MKKIERYVFAVAVAAMTAGVILYLNAPSVPPAFIRVALVFGAISLLARLLNHQIGKDTNGSLAFIPMLASAAMAPHWITVAAVGLSALFEQLLQRRSWQKVVFNTTQYSLSVGAAILAYRAVGGVALHNIGEATAASLIILFLVF